MIAAGCRGYGGMSARASSCSPRGAGGKYHFTLVAPNGQVIATSETCQRRQAPLSGIESVKKNAPRAEIDNQTGE